MGDKETKHFSEIHRYFNQLTNKNVRYKPFHNQLAKPEFAQLMRDVADKVFNHRVNTKLKCNHPVLASFDKLLIRDGSSFAIHKALKKNYTGRFTSISPAAVELHVTYDLKTGGIEKSTLTPDSFSERAELPDVHELENQLLSGDRGYYSGQLINETDDHGGYYILRAMRLSRIAVHRATREDGQVVNKRTKPLSDLLKSLPKRQLIDMVVEIDARETRLIAIWSPKEKRHTFLVTNLKAEQFSATQISQLYRLRWQIELLFKECKSHNNLQGFQTSNPALMEALVWSSLIATMLKRFICSSIEQFYQMEMSTLTVSKTTVYWWYSLLESIVNHKRKQLTDVLERTYFFLKENAGRAHPKRDKSTSDELFEQDVELITNVRRNMKTRAIALWDKIMLKKRFIIETVNEQLKNITQIEHSRHRSVSGFMLNLIGSLIAYCHKKDKPTIRIDESDMKTLCI